MRQLNTPHHSGSAQTARQRLRALLAQERPAGHPARGHHDHQQPINTAASSDKALLRALLAEGLAAEGPARP